MENFFVPASNSGLPVAGGHLTDSILNGHRISFVPYTLGDQTRGFLLDEDSFPLLCRVFCVLPQTFTRGEFAILMPRFEPAFGLLASSEVIQRIIDRTAPREGRPAGSRPAPRTPMWPRPEPDATTQRNIFDTFDNILRSPTFAELADDTDAEAVDPGETVHAAGETRADTTTALRAAILTDAFAEDGDGAEPTTLTVALDETTLSDFVAAVENAGSAVPDGGRDLARSILDRLRRGNTRYEPTAQRIVEGPSGQEILNRVRQREAAAQSRPAFTLEERRAAASEPTPTVPTPARRPTQSVQPLEITTPEYREFLQAVDRSVRLHRCDGHAVTPVRSGHLYHVWLYAIPRDASGRAVTPETYWARRDLFGFRWSRHTDTLSLKPGGMGRVITDDEGTEVAEVVGSDIFILHNLRNFDAAERADHKVLLTVLRKALEVTAEMESEVRARKLEEVREPYLAFCSTFETNRVQGLRGQIHTLTGEIARMQQTLTTKLRDLRALQVQADALVNDTGSRQAVYAAEFERIKAMPKVRSLVVNTRNKTLEVLTTPLTCINPATQIEHALGSYRLVFNLRESGAELIRFHNQTRKVSDKNHPHVDENGRACFGNFGEGLAELVAAGEYATLIAMALRFLESVNPADAWGRTIKDWPTLNGGQPVTPAAPAAPAPRSRGRFPVELARDLAR